MHQEDAEFGAFDGEAVGVGFGHPLNESMQAQLTQIVAQLIEGVVLGLEIVGVHDGLVEAGSGPAAQMAGGPLQERFQQAHQAGVFQFDASDFGLALEDRLSQAGQNVELTMDIEQLGLGVGKAVGDLLETLPHGFPVGQGFFEGKILEVVADNFLAQKGAGLFVLLEEGVFEVGAEDLLAVIDPFDDILPFAPDAAARALAKEGGNPVDRQKIKAQLAGTMENGTDRPMTLEDEVAAVFDLADGVETMESSAGQAFPLGELGAEDQGPIINPLLDDFGVQLVGGLLQGGGIGHREEPVVLFAEGDFLAQELPFDEVVAVEISGQGERQERADAQGHRTGDLVVDVEIIMSETAAVLADKPQVWVLGGILRGHHAESPTLLHALEDVINAAAALPRHPAQGRAHPILFALAGHSPFQRQVMVAGISGHPGLIDAGALPQHFLGHDGLLAELAEKPGDIDFPDEEGQIAVDDDAIKAMIKPLQMRRKELKKKLHGRPFLGFLFGHSNSRRDPHAWQAAVLAEPFNSQRYLKFSEGRFRQPNEHEDQRRLRSSLQKISNIFG